MADNPNKNINETPSINSNTYDEITNGKFNVIQKNVVALFNNEQNSLSNTDTKVREMIAILVNEKKEFMAENDKKIAIIDDNNNKIVNSIIKNREEDYKKLNANLNNVRALYDKQLIDAEELTNKNKIKIDGLTNKNIQNYEAKVKEINTKYEQLVAAANRAYEVTKNKRQETTLLLQNTLKKERVDLDNKYETEKMQINQQIVELHNTYKRSVEQERSSFAFYESEQISGQQRNIADITSSTLMKINSLNTKVQDLQKLISSPRTTPKEAANYKKQMITISGEIKNEEKSRDAKISATNEASKKAINERKKQLDTLLEQHRQLLINNVCMSEQRLRNLDATYVKDLAVLDRKRSSQTEKNRIDIVKEAEDFKVTLAELETKKNTELALIKQESDTIQTDIDLADAQFSNKKQQHLADCAYKLKVKEISTDFDHKKIEVTAQQELDKKECDYQIAKYNQDKVYKIGLLNKNFNISVERKKVIAAIYKSENTLTKKLNEQFSIRNKFATDPIRKSFEDTLRTFATKMAYLTQTYYANLTFIEEKIVDSYTSNEVNTIDLHSQEAKQNDFKGVENANKDLAESIRIRRKDYRNELLKSIDKIHSLYDDYIKYISNSFLDCNQQTLNLLNELNNEYTRYNEVTNSLKDKADNLILRNSDYFIIVLHQQIDIIEETISSNIASKLNTLQQNIDMSNNDFENFTRYNTRLQDDAKTAFDNQLINIENEYKNRESELFARKHKIEQDTQQNINAYDFQYKQTVASRDRVMHEENNNKLNLEQALSEAGQKTEEAYRQALADSETLTKDNIKLNIDTPTTNMLAEGKWWVKKTSLTVTKTGKR